MNKVLGEMFWPYITHELAISRIYIPQIHSWHTPCTHLAANLRIDAAQPNLSRAPKAFWRGVHAQVGTAQRTTEDELVLIYGIVIPGVGHGSVMYYHQIFVSLCSFLGTVSPIMH